MRKKSSLLYLCDPDIIEETLRSVPRLKEKLQQSWGVVKKTKGSSPHFPDAVQARQEIFRFLSNPQYPHLIELLGSIDYCLAEGYEPMQVLRTTSRDEFESGLSELLFAELCLRAGFSVQNLDREKQSKKISDLRVSREQVSFIVELYRPREKLGLDQLQEELRLAIVHLDLPYDFCCKVRFDVENEFDKAGNMEFFQPWKLSNFFVDQRSKRQVIIDSVRVNLAAALKDLRDSSFSISLRNTGVNAKIQVTLTNVQKNKFRLPARLFVLTQPGSGIGPEFVFDTVVKRGIRTKIKDKQLASGAENDDRILVIDTSDLPSCIPCFGDKLYLTEFISSIDKHLTDKIATPDAPDFIFFFAPRLVPELQLVVQKTPENSRGVLAFSRMNQEFRRVDVRSNLAYYVVDMSRNIDNA